MKAWAPNGRDVVDWPGCGFAPESWTEERRERAAERCKRTKPHMHRKLAKGMSDTDIDEARSEGKRVEFLIPSPASTDLIMVLVDGVIIGPYKPDR